LRPLKNAPFRSKSGIFDLILNPADSGKPFAKISIRFGTKKPLKVYVESTIMDLPFIYINAGRKGLLARISSEDLVKVLKPIWVNVAI